MSQNTVVISGATGHVGGALARLLLDRGQRVRVIGREVARLQPLVKAGAEAHVGSADDAAFLTRAFTGATAAFALIPPDPGAANFRAYQNRIAEAYATALGKAGVTHLVNLSSLGAHLPSGTGPIAGLHDAEQIFNRLEGVHIVHLRPTYFMENHLYGIGMIKGMGIYGSPMRSDVRLPQIATRDVAAEAARLLAEPSFAGHTTRELLGAADLNMVEVTRTLGHAIAKPDLAYVQFPYAEARKAMLGMGMSESVADAMVEMNRAFNEDAIKPSAPRSPANTTPTTLEEFARTVFAPAFKTS